MERHVNNAASWFEIPVRDLDRARRFYERVLNTDLKREKMGPDELAIFPSDAAGVGGCLQAGQTMPSPSTQGTLVYLVAQPSLASVLDRVEAAGGRITTPHTALPPGMGFIAHIEDTEGNRVGLHSMA